MGGALAHAKVQQHQLQLAVQRQLQAGEGGGREAGRCDSRLPQGPPVAAAQAPHCRCKNVQGTAPLPHFFPPWSARCRRRPCSTAGWGRTSSGAAACGTRRRRRAAAGREHREWQQLEQGLGSTSEEQIAAQRPASTCSLLLSIPSAVPPATPHLVEAGHIVQEYGLPALEVGAQAEVHVLHSGAAAAGWRGRWKVAVGTEIAGQWVAGHAAAERSPRVQRAAGCGCRLLCRLLCTVCPRLARTCSTRRRRRCRQGATRLQAGVQC